MVCSPPVIRRSDSGPLGQMKQSGFAFHFNFMPKHNKEACICLFAFIATAALAVFLALCGGEKR